MSPDAILQHDNEEKASVSSQVGGSKKKKVRVTSTFQSHIFLKFR